MPTADAMKDLYEFAKREVDAQRDRYARLDAKAATYFSVITLLLGAYAFVGQWVLEHALPPRGVCDSLLALVSLVELAVLLVTFFSLFSVIRIQGMRYSAADDSVSKFFLDQPLPTVHHAYARQMLNDSLEDSKVVSMKSEQLAKAYNWMICSVVGITAQFVLVAACKSVEVTVHWR